MSVMNLDQNIFREYDIRGEVGPQLTEEVVSLIGKALGTFYARNGAKRIAVGFDARESSPIFKDILVSELNGCGCDAVVVGQVPTPVLYHTVFTQEVDGGVMITGSHNPANHNGFKISIGKQTLFGGQIQEIKQILLAGDFTTGTGTVSYLDVMEGYVADIVSKVSVGERVLKVVVDGGNGMGGVTAVPVFNALGCELVELFTEPDSRFPNHHPDPTVEENLLDAVAAVREHKADLAIAFDGDGDRIGVVEETGRIIWGDELMILLSREILKTNPGATIIGEVKCSSRLYDDITAKGGKPIMWKAGHSLIKSKMKETGAALAGEMSGHIFFADRFYGFDDATYAGARLIEILSKTSKPLSELLSDLPASYFTPELRMPCSEERKFEVVKEIAEIFSETNEVITIDGARIIFEDGWGLVRASNTQAILVLRFEAKSAESLERIRKIVETELERLI
jgi:phosphomannomutase / phosphoglucomutase